MSSKDSGITPGTLLICSAKGLAVGIITAAVLLFALAGVAYSMADPNTIAEPLGYVSLFLSAVAAGITASRSSGNAGYISALFGGCAGMLMLILLLFMALLPAEAATQPLSAFTNFIMHAAIPVSAAIGGLLFRKKKTRKPLHRRRRRHIKGR